MQTIYLTRHGETSWNLQQRFQGRGNSPLTALGEAQARSLQKKIKELDIQRVIASPLKRALDTANIITSGSKLEVMTCPELMELSLGAWEGRTYRELNELDPDNFHKYWNDPFQYTPKGGETFQELIERSAAAKAEILRLSQGKTTLVVTHGMTLMALLHVFTKEDFSAIMKRRVFPQVSLTRLDESEDGFEVIYEARTDHYDFH